MAENNGNTFSVKDVIRSIQEDVNEIRTKDIPGLKVDIATLKVKAGIWGFVSGAIPASTVLAYLIIKGM